MKTLLERLQATGLTIRPDDGSEVTMTPQPGVLWTYNFDDQGRHVISRIVLFEGAGRYRLEDEAGNDMVEFNEPFEEAAIEIWRKMEITQ